MHQIVFVVVFLIALAGSVLLTALMRALAFRWGLVDRPDHRKIHKHPTPLLGGVAIYFSFAGSILFGSHFLLDFPAPPSLHAILLASLIVVVLGLYDDLKGSSAEIKFLWQLAAALIVIQAGIRIDQIKIPFFEYIDFGIWAWPVTCLWLVGLSNAFNLIDGLDGLAAGVAMFAAFTIFATAVRWGETEVAVLCISLAGCLLGFLRYNFHPARIFMGDAGSLLLGFLLGVLSIMEGSKSTAGVAFLIPITALAIPILDTSIAIVRRVRNGRQIFLADREHIHHRLLHIGLSHRQAVLIIYLASLYLGIVSFGMTFVPPDPRAVVFGVLVVSGTLILRRWSSVYKASVGGSA